MDKINCKIEELNNNLTNPLLIIISGPSGVGKDAILNRMKKKGYPFEFIMTVTTRRQRPSEKDNLDYHFISEEEFQDLLRSNGLLESAKVYQNWYGVPRAPVKEALSKAIDTIIKVDVQGAGTLKKLIPQALFIFIAPPSFEELKTRLANRSTETDKDLEIRLRTAESEMDQIVNFDYVIISRRNGIDKAIEQIMNIVAAEKHRTNPRKFNL